MTRRVAWENTVEVFDTRGKATKLVCVSVTLVNLSPPFARPRLAPAPNPS
jgi:hypothetical protein